MQPFAANLHSKKITKLNIHFQAWVYFNTEKMKDTTAIAIRRTNLSDFCFSWFEIKSTLGS
jgi:hypothetical protein